MKYKLLLFLLLTSCFEYHPDPVKTPEAEHWKEPNPNIEEATICPPATIVCETSVISPWWTVYNDALLNSLEEQAVVNSPTIQQAIAKLKESEAFYGIVRSD